MLKTKSFVSDKPMNNRAKTQVAIVSPVKNIAITQADGNTV